MKVNGTTYGFRIEPTFSKVRVEIYKELILFSKYNNDPTEIGLLNKSFGSICRSSPIEEDYKKAREWAEEQLQFIYHANKQS